MYSSENLREIFKVERLCNIPSRPHPSFFILYIFPRPYPSFLKYISPFSPVFCKYITVIIFTTLRSNVSLRPHPSLFKYIPSSWPPFLKYIPSSSPSFWHVSYLLRTLDPTPIWNFASPPPFFMTSYSGKFPWDLKKILDLSLL
mgnify:CR=1 FL=1